MKEPTKFWIDNKYISKDWAKGQTDFVLASEYELLKILYADIEAQRNRLADEWNANTKTQDELQQELGSLKRHLIKAWSNDGVL